MTRIKLFFIKISHKVNLFLKHYKLEKAGYRYSLIDVTSENNNTEVKLHIIVQGIKKQIFTFNPHEIVHDDELISEFSPCDIRAITYLSFQKYIEQEKFSLMIVKQYIDNGQTFFGIKEVEGNLSVQIISANKLYQNYEILTKLRKKDMVNVISTAVQEQTFLDIKKMAIL